MKTASSTLTLAIITTKHPLHPYSIHILLIYTYILIMCRCISWLLVLWNRSHKGYSSFLVSQEAFLILRARMILIQFPLLTLKQSHKRRLKVQFSCKFSLSGDQLFRHWRRSINSPPTSSYLVASLCSTKNSWFVVHT